MDWSPQQEDALAAVEAWLANPQQQVFYLAGYAGTGKTTLAKYLADGVGGLVLFGAFTGKAALVLRQRGCHGAQTIHQMIYRPKNKSEARYRDLQEALIEAQSKVPMNIDEIHAIEKDIADEEQNLKRPSFTLNLDSDAAEAALIVIDEVSMVGQDMGEDLESFGRPILCLGDPAQLPPVGGAGYFTRRKPDMTLTEIHRQAEGSPIIGMATKVRSGDWLGEGDYGEGCRVIKKGTLSLEQMAEFDQILCGRNKTRRIINSRMRREHLQRETHLPEPGDRLVCLRNNHDLGLLNGSIWIVLEAEVVNDDEIGLTLNDEDSDAVITTVAHRHYFEDREPAPFQIRERDSFDYGYALTVHKSQGSQWPNVAVVDESWCFRDDAKKHLYTAVTRAQEAVTVIK